MYRLRKWFYLSNNRRYVTNGFQMCFSTLPNRCLERYRLAHGFIHSTKYSKHMKSDHIYYQTFITSSYGNPIEIIHCNAHFRNQLRGATTFTILTSSLNDSRINLVGGKVLGIVNKAHEHTHIQIITQERLHSKFWIVCLYLLIWLKIAFAYISWHSLAHSFSISLVTSFPFNSIKMLDFARRPNFKHPVDANKHKEAWLLLHSDL